MIVLGFWLIDDHSPERNSHSQLANRKSFYSLLIPTYLLNGRMLIVTSDLSSSVVII